MSNDNPPLLGCPFCGASARVVLAYDQKSPPFRAMGRGRPVAKHAKRPVVVYSKRASKRQRAWLQNYYDKTGFDALGQEDFDARKITFEEVRLMNVKWWEDFAVETQHDVERYP